MGLTNDSLNESKIDGNLNVKKDKNEIIISLAGNPNVGKSSIFNILTGMKQHTGNWPGKTIGNTIGTYYYKDKKHTIVDIPGTYSLMANSKEEEIARDFICFSNSDLTLIVIDATNIKRNLNLVLQILEVTNNVILCINLIDEAEKRGIKIDVKNIEKQLGIPIVKTSAKTGKGIDKLKDTIYNFKANKGHFDIDYGNIINTQIKELEDYIDKNYNFNLNSKFLALKLLDEDDNIYRSLNKYLNYDFKNDQQINEIINKCRNNLEKNNIKMHMFRDIIVSKIMDQEKTITKDSIINTDKTQNKRNNFIDKLLTSKITGIPIMLIMLLIIFWITIVGSNCPSDLLTKFFEIIGDKLLIAFNYINIPKTITSFLLSGVYKTVTWIISVMLPPMAIFFPLFTFLEDLGLLPRIAFNLDNVFKKCGSHGKQSLTMCMGFGCNACGVVGARIIESKKDRLLAIITNNFVPCNGRFPTLISLITMFLLTSFKNEKISSIVSALILTLLILSGILMTLLITKILSKIMHKEDSYFILELPPYRKPKIFKTIIRSIFDRTLFVLSRAIKVAIPAGALIWLLANININNFSLLSYLTDFFDPIGRFFGLDGTIIVAFLLGFPANEIVIPLIIMSYLNSNTLMEISNLKTLKELFINNGWTITTAICTMIFCLFHYPCGTTLYTIKKETNSNKITLISFLIPTIIGLILCFITKLILNIIV